MISQNIADFSPLSDGRGISFNPSQPDPGDTVTVTGQFSNIGTLDNEDDLDVVINQNGNEIVRQRFTDVEPVAPSGNGGPYTFSVDIIAELGIHSFELILDVNGNLTEAREDNNNAIVDLSVVEPYEAQIDIPNQIPRISPGSTEIVTVSLLATGSRTEDWTLSWDDSNLPSGWSIAPDGAQNNNPNLIDEVVNLVDSPNILLCNFDKKFLSIPKEIIILTMESHQKYFPTFNDKNEITNEFLIVTNKKDQKGLIKIGNERVVEARLNDAEFFWNKDKTQNLIKKISELRSINFFKGLGTYFDKVQRMRKLGGMISDELLISKEKVELSASICKTDLTSGLVGEFPELQGLMGGYFSAHQGFDKDISLALTEQYLPIGLNSKIPKKPFSIALSITDKIDTIVGFFGINEKPTSSKDPLALRRVALGIIRTLIENKRNLKINDLLNYSGVLYEDQGFNLVNKDLNKELYDFFKDRFRYYLKEKFCHAGRITVSYGMKNFFPVFNQCGTIPTTMQPFQKHGAII